MHKLTEAWLLGVHGGLCGSAPCSQVQDAVLPSCELSAKAEGEDLGCAHEKGAVSVKGWSALTEMGRWAAQTHESSVPLVM